MTDAPDRTPGLSDPGLGFRPFVGLIAALMAVNALGIDSMLAALPDIAHAVGIARENDRQWIISLYMFGFGAAQLIYGPLADRYGRKPVLVIGLSLYALTSVAAAASTSFPMLLVTRLAQGAAAASARVLVVSIVRDCYGGRQMARVMSLAFIVFLAVPALAPSVGQLILLVASWRFIFLFLAAFALLLALWVAMALKETLRPEWRRSIQLGEIGRAARAVVTERNSRGYTLGSTLVFGGLLGFINSVQQVFADQFHAPARFPLMFAAMAGAMGVAGFTNSRAVERYGTRRLSHAALLLFIAIAAAHSAVAVAGRETMLSFSLFQCAQMACFGLMGSNFGAMAMDRMSHIAGTAASVQGFASTVGGAAIGIVIGQMFDGTSTPLALGFLVMGLLALGVVLWTEQGRLFRPQHASA